jgi:hypothetical protein
MQMQKQLLHGLTPRATLLPARWSVLTGSWIHKATPVEKESLMLLILALSPLPSLKVAVDDYYGSKNSSLTFVVSPLDSPPPLLLQ